MPAAHQDIDDLADLIVATHDGVDLPAACLFGQIHGELPQRVLLTHLRGGQGSAGFARLGAANERRAISGSQVGLRGAGDNLLEIIGQRIRLDLVELP